MCQGSAADNMTKCDQMISLWAQGSVCFHLCSRDAAGGGLTSVETEYSHFAAPRAVWAVCILPCPGITLSAEIGRDELQLVPVQLPWDRAVLPGTFLLLLTTQSPLAWKSPARPSSPNIPPALPRLPITQVPKCHLHMLRKVCKNGSPDVTAVGRNLKQAGTGCAWNKG